MRFWPKIKQIFLSPRFVFFSCAISHSFFRWQQKGLLLKQPWFWSEHQHGNILGATLDSNIHAAKLNSNISVAKFCAKS
jgi:hypothetical protein